MVWGNLFLVVVDIQPAVPQQHGAVEDNQGVVGDAAYPLAPGAGQGRKVLDGTLESIQNTYGTDTIRVAVDDFQGRLDDLPGVVAVTDFGRCQDLRIDSGAEPQQILGQLMRRGQVRHFEIMQPTLHDIFVRIARPAALPEEVAHA